MIEPLSFQQVDDYIWLTLRNANLDLGSGSQAAALCDQIEQHGIKRLVVDLSQLPYFGSSLLEFFILLWRRIGQGEGRLIIYKPSSVGREVLAAARLNQLWPIAEERDDAIRLVRE
jgi:anti-anti-sigma factor